MSTSGATSAECKTAGGQPTLPDAPWSGLPTDDDRDALTEAAINHREGAPLLTVAREAFGEGSVDGGANYQLARRHLTGHPELFHTAKKDGLLWVWPTPDLLRRVSLDQQESTPSEGRESAQHAKINAGRMLHRRTGFDSAAERGDLLGAFAAKRSATAGRFHALQDTFDPENHRLVPFATRFNSEERVSDTRERYRTAWERAADRHDRGVVLTLTTDPSRFESLGDACEDLLADVNRLKDWLAYDPEGGPSRPGYRPPSVVAPEFTEDGKPHVHVAFFGVSWLSTHGAMSRYWSEERDRGEVVWTDDIHERGGRWRWGQGADPAHADATATSPREYLRAGVDLLAASASATAEEVAESAEALRAAEEGREAADTVARERGERLWKAALYWATDLPAVTVSPTLKPDSDGESDRRATAPDGTPLPDDAPSRWRYVGAARYDELPGYVRDGATVVQPSEHAERCRGEPPPLRT